jgi:hypothetical protein
LNLGGERQLRLQHDFSALAPGELVARREQVAPQIDSDAERNRERDVADPRELPLGRPQRSDHRSFECGGQRVGGERGCNSLDERAPTRGQHARVVT